jgi:hypothetical protein
MKAKHFGSEATTRKGLFSVLDSEARNANERKVANVKPSMSLTAIDDTTGQAIPNATMVMNGKVMTADSKGRMRLVDEQVLAYQRSLRDEMEAGISRIVEYCLASDATCQDVLGLTEATYDKVLGPSGTLTKAEKDEYGLPAEFWGWDARIRTLQLYPEESITFRQGLAKLRGVIMARRPNLLGGSGVTETALKAQDDPDA